MDDARWVIQAVAGSREAHRTLFVRYRAQVARLARGFGELDEDGVQDVVEESFVRAFARLPGLREPGRFCSWLLTMARSRCLSTPARSSNRMRAIGDFGREADVELAQDSGPEEAELEVVREVINALEDGPEKETVRLFYLEGTLSAREIARRFGVDKSAITMRLERFRAKVKARLSARILELRGELPPGLSQPAGEARRERA